MPSAFEELKKKAIVEKKSAFEELKSKAINVGEQQTPSISTDLAGRPTSSLPWYEKPGATLGNFGVGAVKGAGSTLAGASQLGEKILQAGTGNLGKKTGVEELGLKEKYLTPEGTAQKVGFGAEQIGEFFIPGGASLKLGKATELATKGSKLSKLAGLGARATGEAGIFGGQTALQQGEINKDTGIAALTGAALPIAGAFLKPIKKLIGSGVSQLLGRSTGAGEQAIKEVFNNPEVINFARQAGAEGAEGLQRKAVEEAKSALDEIKNLRRKEYTGQLSKISGSNVKQKVIVDELGAKTDELISPSRYDIIVKNGKVDFSRSTITEGQASVQKAITDITNWKDFTPAGLDTLKKRLGDYISQSPSRTPARALLTELKSTLTKGLDTNIKGYKEMTSRYRQASELIDELERGLSLGDRASIETASRKLMSSMRQNNELRNEMLKTLEKYGGKDITGKIAGATFTSLTPRGLAGTLAPGFGGAGVITAAFNPAAWPAVITYLAASSPRLVGEFISLMGKASRGVNGLIKPNAFLTKQLQRIFGEAK